eukprot:TRINITY_DN64393_c0_g1_i1.p1 TRINITY_DN64393_c0_g1~~TRINITY_DN64393_c0_g1_i1.p1  ORF type:complete len:276 (-),score=46.94 TRINITY_DN64393_c0_g1_i1:116-943(-)
MGNSDRADDFQTVGVSMTAPGGVIHAQATRWKFLDLLEEHDEEEDESIILPAFAASRALLKELTHGPFLWNTSRGVALQKVVDSLCIQELLALNFSVTLADPLEPDCPLIACSIGFTELTGYTVGEIVGRNCRLLLNGVPPELADEDTRYKCRGFCLSSSKCEIYNGESKRVPSGLSNSWADLPSGEMICVQTNAKRSGELFRNMFYLKQVQLDEHCFILGLQAALADDFEEFMDARSVQMRMQMAFMRLEENMSAVEQILAQQFWYSAPMRRQK